MSNIPQRWPAADPLPPTDGLIARDSADDEDEEEEGEEEEEEEDKPEDEDEESEDGYSE